MNIAIQAGHICRDIEITHTSGNGTAVGSFTLAVNHGYGDNKKTSFFNYKIWGKQAEAAKDYFKKGIKLLIESEPTQESWETKDGKKASRYIYYVKRWEFCESKATNLANQQQAQGQDSRQQPQQTPKPQIQNPPPTPQDHPWMTIPENYGDNLPFV